MDQVVIIGGGVVGAAVAYELAHYRVNVLWLEKENDLAMGATRANSAIIHGGYDPRPGSWMGKMNAPAAKRCFELCEKLNIEHKKTGSLIIGFDEEDRKTLQKLYEQGLENEVPEMALWGPEEIRRHEPLLSEEVTCALFIPVSGVINPWEFAIAMGEVAVRNGVRLERNRQVVEIQPCEEGGFTLTACDPQGKRHSYEAQYVINAAGVYSDQIHNLVAEPGFEIVPTRGEYYLLDQAIGQVVHSVIFQCPNAKGKGVLVAPTIHGNTLVGPNAEILEDRENTAVTRSGLDYVAASAKRSVPGINMRSSIRNYAGIRANSHQDDFYLGWARPGFLDLAAIKSPGLTCAPLLGTYAIDQLREAGLALEAREDFRDGRDVTRFKEIPETERAGFIRKHPLYGRVVCRCETITEGEIVDAIHREIPPVSLDGIKRRAGSGMGRCQGGFCGPKVLEILARETGLDPLDITLDATGSFLLIGETKEVSPDEA